MLFLGKIRFAKLANCGNCVDSVAAARGGYYDLAKQAYLAGGFNVLVDSAFRLGYGTIATNNALLDISGNPSHLVSMRQSAEWGMRIIQCWKRLKCPGKPCKRRIYLNLIVVCHLVNFLQSNGMPNQIRSTFGDQFEEYLDNDTGVIS